MTNQPANYLPDTEYDAMIDALVAARDAHDPKTKIIEIVGEHANIWPESVLEDEDAATPIKSRVYVAMVGLALGIRRTEPEVGNDVDLVIDAFRHVFGTEPAPEVKSSLKGYFAAEQEHRNSQRAAKTEAEPDFDKMSNHEQHVYAVKATMEYIKKSAQEEAERRKDIEEKALENKAVSASSENLPIASILAALGYKHRSA